MSETIVTLKKGEGRTLKAGGMWVFDNEIESIMGRFENGSIVTVHDFDGYPMGRGFINQNSKIRIRLMTRNVNQEIDREFLRDRVRMAWEYRKKTVDTGSCRVIFGEADFLPGLVIDKFSDVLVVESLALGIDRFKLEIVELPEQKLPESPAPAEIEQALAREAALIEEKLPKGGAVIALCIEGTELSSEALSKKLAQLASAGASQLTFLIGGSFGLHPRVKQRADLRLSMSPMTFPHHLARVMLLEQLYRAYQIDAGTRYHK